MVQYGVIGAVGGATAKDLEEFVAQKIPKENGKHVYSLHNKTSQLRELLFGENGLFFFLYFALGLQTTKVCFFAGGSMCYTFLVNLERKSGGYHW